IPLPFPRFAKASRYRKSGCAADQQILADSAGFCRGHVMAVSQVPARTGRRVSSGGRSVAVVGAGLGGLSAAIHLRLAGHRVTMFESNSLVGGRANLLVEDGFRFDTGPSLLNYPWVFEDLF